MLLSRHVCFFTFEQTLVTYVILKTAPTVTVHNAMKVKLTSYINQQVDISLAF